MQISIRTRRFVLGPTTRRLIERYLAKALNRKPFRFSAVTLYLRPARIHGSDVELSARLVVRSPGHKQIAINDVDVDLGRLMTRIVRRARYVARCRQQRKRWKNRVFATSAVKAPVAAEPFTPRWTDPFRESGRGSSASSARWSA